VIGKKVLRASELECAFRSVEQRNSKQPVVVSAAPLNAVQLVRVIPYIAAKLLRLVIGLWAAGDVRGAADLCEATAMKLQQLQLACYTKEGEFTFAE